MVIKMMNVGGRLLGRWASINISFPERNSALVRNTVMVLGKIIEEVSAECCV